MITTTPFNHCPNYWLSHSVGRPLNNTEDTFKKHFLTSWQQPEPWPYWLETLNQFKQQVAHLLSTDADSICPQVNISSALTKVLTAISQNKSPLRILLSEADFATISFVAMQVANAELVYIPADFDVSEISTWQDYLSADIDVALITHVFSNTGQRAPVKDIVECCRQHDIISIVDIAQAAGVIPIDVKLWQCDVAIGTSVKWLSGGPGAAFMYLEPSFCAQLSPADVGWFSHKNPFEFDVHHFEYDDTSHRFLGGTPSIVPFALAAASIEAINALGVDNILDANRRASDALMAGTPTHWWRSPHRSEQRGGTLIFNPEASVADRLRTAQVKGLIHLDERATGFRLSPCWSTTDADIDNFHRLISG